MTKCDYIYRHHAIVHIRDNYSYLFVILSHLKPRYDLDDYTDYCCALGTLRAKLKIQNDFYDNKYYKELYNKMISKKDVMERLEAEVVMDAL